MTISSVVYYPGPWHVGGAESYVLNVARALGTFGEVAILSASRPDDALLEKLRLPVDFRPEWRLERTCNQMSVNRLARGDIFVNCSPWDYPVPPKGSMSALIAYFAPELGPTSAAQRLTRKVAARLLTRRRLWEAPLPTIARYDKVLCVSRWTAELAVRRWHRPVEVFYPAVRPVPPQPKERLILTVGRLAAGGTRKGHADLIEAFGRLELPGWRLAVAGAVNYAGSAEVIEGWRRELEDAAVEIVPNPTDQVLEGLYGRASLYWHGAGFGAEPGSIGREHFGISVVEAMSAGAVPVCFEGGGVREIVTSGEDGLLWGTLPDLLEATRRLAGDDETAQRLRRAARLRARSFDIERHDLRLHDLLIRPLQGESSRTG